MSRRADPAAIGGFVIGAVVLLIAAVLVFSGDRFFTRKLTYVMYFDGSVQGLSIGAPVALRGVKIGTVKEIQVLHDANDNRISVPVTVEIFGKKVKTSGQRRSASLEEVQNQIQQLVKQGLRATLALQSLVTGQLYVELEFMQDVKPASIERRDGVYIFPTEVSRLSELAQEVQELPLSELANKALSALEGINRVFGSPEMIKTLKSVEHAASGIDELVLKLNDRVDVLSGDLRKTVRALNGLVSQGDVMVGNIDQELGALINRFNTTAGQTEQTLAALRDTIGTYQALPSQDSVFGFEMFQLLRELSAASRSIRAMADYLEQHPEALIKGKPGGGNE